MFKSVIFPAISLSWCVASGLTGPPGPGEHELVEGLSLSSPPTYLGSPSTPRERFMERIKQPREMEKDRGRARLGISREDRREFRRVPLTPGMLRSLMEFRGTPPDQVHAEYVRSCIWVLKHTLLSYDRRIVSFRSFFIYLFEFYDLSSRTSLVLDRVEFWKICKNYYS